jgi:hypothetical protein
MAKRKNRTLRGGEPHGLRPDWRPLLDFVPDEVPEFRWMFRVELEDGSVVEAYKHSWTRQYLHLDENGRAFRFVGGRSYEEVDPEELLSSVLANCEPRANIVRQNVWVDGQRVGWARSATRHRVSRARSLWIIQHAGICFERGVGSHGDRILSFFGDDQDECPLEVAAAVSSTEKLTVIHAMELREKFETEYMEALRWRR